MSDVKGAIDALYDDVLVNWKSLEADDSQQNRRNYVRALFAFYEAALSNVRETAARQLVREFTLKDEWRVHELYPLLDQKPRLSGNGKLGLDPNRFPFIEVVAYTLKLLAQLTNSQQDVLSDYRWHDFRKSIRIRHRITHPKFHSDVEITDEEMEILERGRHWWNEITKNLIE